MAERDTGTPPGPASRLIEVERKGLVHGHPCRSAAPLGTARADFDRSRKTNQIKAVLHLKKIINSPEIITNTTDRQFSIGLNAKYGQDGPSRKCGSAMGHTVPGAQNSACATGRHANPFTGTRFFNAFVSTEELD